jgi:hypothetical protein
MVHARRVRSPRSEGFAMNAAVNLSGTMPDRAGRMPALPEFTQRSFLRQQHGMHGHPERSEGSLATEWSHLFSLVLYRFDRELPHFVRDDSALGVERWTLSVESWTLASRSGGFLRQLHGPLEFRRVFFDAEISGIEFLNLRHVVRRQRRGVGSFCKFDELFFVINVR